jgi:cyanoexosortase A
MRPAVEWATRELRDPRSLWKTAGALQAILSVWLAQATQHNPSLTLLAVVVWGGAVICMEDQMDTLKIRPSQASLVTGLIIVLFATWRSCTIMDADTSIFALPLLQGIGLAFMTAPIRKVWSLWQPLLVLSLFTLQELISRLLPEQLLASVTARIGQFILLMCGTNAAASGQFLTTGLRPVFVTGACSSVDLIAQLTVISIVFVIAFPIKSLPARIFYLALAPICAIVVNAGRIGALAWITGSDLENREQLFRFWHDEWGALVFAGIAMMIMGQIYLTMIEHQLRHDKI